MVIFKHALARYPMLHNTWLGWGHTVYGSEDSHADNTKLCGVVLLSPGVFGDPASVCTLPNGEPVNFYQVIPLYREEIEFKREHDVDRLLEKFPDELLEVIDPARPNVITDAEAIAYDDALMDEAKTHLAVIRDKQLPVEELAAYNHMAIYLRWCMEHDRMSNPFLAEHKDVVEAVKGGQVSDLRVFLRDSEDLRGRLHLTWFDREGTEFARWYSWGSKATPYNYNKDIAAHARAYFRDDRHGGEAYLFVPWDERYYQEMAEIISQRFAQWEALEENQEPRKTLCIRPEDIRPLLPDWNGPRGCFASDRVMVDGCKVGEDEVEGLAEKAKEFVKDVLADETSEYYGIVSYFMEFHRDDLPENMVKALFPVENPSALTLTEMADYLQLKRFGSFLDEETEEQRFIMDLTFDPEITNELLVIYFNADRQIVNISHES